MKTKKLLSMLSLVVILGISLSACNNVKDSDLQAKSAEALTTIAGASDVKVSVLDKVATLNGTVTDEATKTNAETTVKGVKGIKSTVNNIVVIPPAPDFSQIDAKLKEALPDALKDHPTVTAEVKDGVIILSGEAKEKDLQVIMEKVSALNPEKVENNITIK